MEQTFRLFRVRRVAGHEQEKSHQNSPTRRTSTRVAHAIGGRRYCCLRTTCYGIGVPPIQSPHQTEV